MPKQSGLRTEILLTLSLLLGAALLLDGMLVLRLAETKLQQERIDSLEVLSRTVAQSLVDNNREVASAKDWDVSLLPSSNDLQQFSNCKGWWFYDLQLRLLSSYSGARPETTFLSLKQQARITRSLTRSIQLSTVLNPFGSEASTAFFFVPLMANDRFLGLLEIHFSLQDIRKSLMKFQLNIFIYLPLYGIVLIFIGDNLLRRNIIRPAQNLLRATDEVSRGNLESALPETGPTEIARLAKAHNGMLSALKKSKHETEKHVESLKKANTELEKTRDELIRSEKLASVGQLAAGLAHELGNPLAALIGYLEILKKEKSSLAANDLVQRALHETNRIDYLVRELLDFSRPSTENVSVDIDIVEVMDACVRLLRNQGHLTSITVLDNLPKKLPIIKMNGNRLQQVFVNLLMNAVQACVNSGKIILSGGASEASVWVEVRDNGCGMPSEVKARIFDPFFTTKEPGEGTGLGLPICQHIVEEVGGQILVDTAPGQGSGFKVSFPRRP